MAENPNPTPKERETHEFLVGFIRENGYAPTMREAARALSVSPTIIRMRLESLERKGYVRRAGRLSRALVVLRPLPNEAGA